MTYTKSAQNKEKTGDFSSIEWLTNQAVKNHKEGKTEEAIAHYLELIELNKQQPSWLYANLISLLNQLGRLDEALGLGEEILETYKESDEIHRAVGAIYSKKKNIEKSIRHFETAIDISFEQPHWVYAQLATNLIEKKNINKALQTANEGISLYPEFHWLYSVLGDALIQKLEWDKAIDAYSKAVEIDDGISSTRDKLELLLIQKGKTENSELENTLRLIAFYLPQFHPIPENDQWWGKGFTEWTNVTKAKPLFKDHYQPHLPADLGFYDLRLQEVREEQAKLARKYGIHGFCYYYYWFAGKRLLQRPVDDMLKSGKPDFPFCLCWANENWTRRWDGAEHDVLIAQDHCTENDIAFAESLIPFLKDNRYIKVNGKPLILIYRADLLPSSKASIETWRQIFRNAGIGEVNVCGALTFGLQLNNLEQMGIDSAVQFPPHGVAANLIDPKTLGADDYKGNIYDFRDVVEHALSTPMPKKKRLFLSTMTAWDNTARKGKAGNVFLHANPDIYELWLRGAIEKTTQSYSGDEQLVFVNAWNEWAEGTHLEPDRKNGHSYLISTCKSINGTHSLETVLQLLRKLPIESNIHLHQLLDDLNTRVSVLNRSLEMMTILSKRLKESHLCISNIHNNTSNKDTISYIESPEAQQQFSKLESFVVAGWVINKISQPKTVELLSNGKLISSSRVNFSRPDIYQAYPEYDSKNSGFHLVYKVHFISDSPLEIYTILEDGTRYQLGYVNLSVNHKSMNVPIKIRKSLKWDSIHEQELLDILDCLRSFPVADNYGELLEELECILNHKKQTLEDLEKLIASIKTDDLF